MFNVIIAINRSLKERDGRFLVRKYSNCNIELYFFSHPLRKRSQRNYKIPHTPKKPQKGKLEFESEAPSGRELSAKQTEGELRNIKQLQTLRYAILLPSFCDALASQKSTSLPEGG